MFTFLLIWFLILSIFLYVSSNLLLSLVVLEILTFFTLFFFSLSTSIFVFSDYYLLIFFSLFVIEGVIGLSGIITLVFFSGSDYLSTSSILNV